MSSKKINNSLKQLNKNELVSIISKLKKDDLINIINTHYVKQNGGFNIWSNNESNDVSNGVSNIWPNSGSNNNYIIKETKNAVRKAIVFNKSKLNKSNKNNNSMNNNNIYNNT